jgi:hypothetical protein
LDVDRHGEDIALIRPEDWSKLRVVLDVFFGVGERNGLPEAPPCGSPRNGIAWSWATPAQAYRAYPDLRSAPQPSRRPD